MPTIQHVDSNPGYYRGPALNPFDKVNLAAQAVARAGQHLGDGDRFAGEYQTVQLWRRHEIWGW